MGFTVSIRRGSTLILLLSGICQISAQKIERSSQIIEIMRSLQGDFNWEMIRPSENKVLRTGTKSSAYQLDSLILLSRETFDSSEIEQMAFFGYSQKDSLFFSVSSYNVDVGPHIIRGVLNEQSSIIEFQENDSTKLFLTIINRNEYYWTYQQFRDRTWKDRDLRINFRRVQ